MQYACVLLTSHGSFCWYAYMYMCSQSDRVIVRDFVTGAYFVTIFVNSAISGNIDLFHCSLLMWSVSMSGSMLSLSGTELSIIAFRVTLLAMIGSRMRVR